MLGCFYITLPTLHREPYTLHSKPYTRDLDGCSGSAFFVRVEIWKLPRWVVQARASAGAGCFDGLFEEKENLRLTRCFWGGGYWVIDWAFVVWCGCGAGNPKSAVEQMWHIKDQILALAFR